MYLFNANIFTHFGTLLKYYYVTFSVKMKFSPICVVYGFHDAYIDLILGNQFNKNVVTRIISKFFLFFFYVEIQNRSRGK